MIYKIYKSLNRLHKIDFLGSGGGPKTLFSGGPKKGVKMGFSRALNIVYKIIKSLIDLIVFHFFSFFSIFFSFVKILP